MRLRFHIIFMVFAFTSILLAAVHLSSARNRLYYELCAARVRQTELKRELWQKQLQLENMTSPVSVWRSIETGTESRNKNQ